MSGLHSKNLIVPIKFPGLENGESSNLSILVHQSVTASFHQSFRIIQNFHKDAMDVVSLKRNGSTKENLLVLLDHQFSLQHSLTTKQIQTMNALAYHASQRMRMQLFAVHSNMDALFSEHAVSSSSSASLSEDLFDCKDKDMLEIVEGLDDNVIVIERLWYLVETVSFFTSPEISYQFIDWLRNEYDDKLKLIAISNFIQKYSQSSIEISSNNLSKAITSRQYQEDLRESIGISYEDTLVWLCLRGYLSLLWSLFTLHPEVSQALSSNISSPVGIDIFQQILFSHPFVTERGIGSSVVVVEDISLSSSSSKAAELLVWKQQIQSLLDSTSSILKQFPSIYLLLQIMSGSEIVLLKSSSSTWQTYLLTTLLYTYSPPLTRRDLSRIVEKSYLAFKGRNSVSDRDESSYRLILDALEGNSVSIIKNIYEIGFTLESTCNRWISLTSAAHLSYILAIYEKLNPNSGLNDNRKGLLAEMPVFVNESSFMEELLLELVEFIADMNINVEILIGYLQLCPKKGKEYICTLIQRISPISDTITIELADILMDLGFPNLASHIYKERGTYWLRKSTLSYRLFGSDDYTISRFGISAAKAIHFYQLAGDHNRTHHILDLLFVRCAYAVRRAVNIFPGFTIDPIRPTPLLLPGSYFFVEPGSKESYILSSAPAQTHEMKTISFQSEELKSSLRDAMDGLEALQYEKDRLCPEAKGLQSYVEGIKLQLQSTSWTDRRNAAQLIAKTLLNGTMFMRHWLHLLELIMWFHISKDEAQAVSMSSGSTSTNVNANTDTDMDNNMEIDSIPRSLFSKSQSYGFLSALNRLTTAFTFKRYTNGCPEESIQAIRKVLLLIYSDSIIYENEIKGTKYVLEKQTAREHEFLRHRHRALGGRNEEEFEMMHLLGGVPFHSLDDL